MNFQTPTLLEPKAVQPPPRDGQVGAEPVAPGDGQNGVARKPKPKPKAVPKAKTPVQEATIVFWLDYLIDILRHMV